MLHTDLDGPTLFELDKLQTNEAHEQIFELRVIGVTDRGVLSAGCACRKGAFQKQSPGRIRVIRRVKLEAVETILEAREFSGDSAPPCS
jgi:hypothetical protein